jgi:iron(III) transport system substrate-binding protein
VRRFCALVLLGAALTACGPAKKQLVVYSPHGPEVLTDYKTRFEAAHPDIELVALDMGSNDVYNRVAAEKNRPTADVWWGGPSSILMQAAKEGLLDPYTPTWAGSVDTAFKDPKAQWFGTYRSPLAIVFNTRKLKPEDVPKTWDELLEPKWNKRITIRKPLASGTMRTFIGAMIMRAASEDAGIEWLRKLHTATESYMESPPLLFDHLKRNEDLITVWLLPDTILQREQNGIPVDCVVPPQTPVLTEGIAIIKGAPHPDLAKTFYEFVTTPAELAYQAEKFAKIPARNDIDPKTLPTWMAELKLDPMTIDWQAFAEKEKAWCDRWDREVYQRK